MNPAFKHHFNYIRAPYMKQSCLTPKSYWFQYYHSFLRKNFITLNVTSEIIPDLEDGLLKL